MKHSPECAYIFDKLKKNLPGHLQYHTLVHTLDVYKSAQFIAQQEGLSLQELKLLLVAVAWHDAGYLVQQKNHENISCNMVKESLPQFGYNQPDIDQICAIIMSTKLPQTAVTLPQMIIADADLDYLGRDDFFVTGRGLYHEMKFAGAVQNEYDWDVIQIKFLEEHMYFTPTNIALRNAKKAENLKILKDKVNNSNGKSIC